MRTYGITKTTNNTKTSFSLNIDGTGKTKVKTGCDFLDHMFEVVAKYANFDIYITCENVSKQYDAFHIVEDVASLFGTSFRETLGDKHGIRRFADCYLPIDDALILAVADIAGGAYVKFDVALEKTMIGDFDTQFLESFFIVFARNAGVTLHVKEISGSNVHNVVEGCFKALARVLRDASAFEDPAKIELPTTKSGF